MNGTPRAAAIRDEVVWPVLAGAVAAVGLWATYRSFGVLLAVAVPGAVYLVVTPVSVDIGVAFDRSWRHVALVVSPAIATSIDVVLGLFLGLGAWALPVLLVVVLTAPPVRGRLTRKARRANETARMRREFEAIVAGEFVTLPPDASSSAPE